MPIKETITPYLIKDSRGRVRESVYGSANYSLEITDETPEEEFKEFFRIIASGTFEGKLNGAEEFAKELLGSNDRLGTFEKGSLPYWGQLILDTLDRLRSALGETSTAEKQSIAYTALSLGLIWARAINVYNNESDILRGKDIASAASVGGHVAAQKRRSELEARNQDLQRRADEIWARNSKLSVAAVSKLLAREPGSGVGFETIRRVIRKETR